MDLKIDILNLLAKRDLRPSEIRGRLFPKYKKIYDSTRVFDVIISRELRKLRNFINRMDKGHQRVYYSLNEHGVKEIERMRLKNHFTNWVDEMDLTEIADWLSRFKEHDLRLRFTDNITVRDKDGKIKGKGIGFGFDSLRYNTSDISVTLVIEDKDKKKINEVKVGKDGKMHSHVFTYYKKRRG